MLTKQLQTGLIRSLLSCLKKETVFQMGSSKWRPVRLCTTTSNSFWISTIRQDMQIRPKELPNSWALTILGSIILNTPISVQPTTDKPPMLHQTIEHLLKRWPIQGQEVAKMRWVWPTWRCLTNRWAHNLKLDPSLARRRASVRFQRKCKMSIRCTLRRDLATTTPTILEVWEDRTAR